MACLRVDDWRRLLRSVLRLCRSRLRRLRVDSLSVYPVRLLPVNFHDVLLNPPAGPGMLSSTGFNGGLSTWMWAKNPQNGNHINHDIISSWFDQHPWCSGPSFPIFHSNFMFRSMLPQKAWPPPPRSMAPAKAKWPPSRCSSEVAQGWEIFHMRSIQKTMATNKTPTATLTVSSYFKLSCFLSKSSVFLRLYSNSTSL